MNQKEAITEKNRIQKSPDDLIRNGLYKTEAWDKVLSNGIPVPKNMLGETDEEKKRNKAFIEAFGTDLGAVLCKREGIKGGS